MIHVYRPATMLRVSGADAFTFLQGQFTNELRQPVGSTVYGLWLNHKGKVVADGPRDEVLSMLAGGRTRLAAD